MMSQNLIVLAQVEYVQSNKGSIVHLPKNRPQTKEALVLAS